MNIPPEQILSGLHLVTGLLDVLHIGKLIQELDASTNYYGGREQPLLEYSFRSMIFPSRSPDAPNAH